MSRPDDARRLDVRLSEVMIGVPCAIASAPMGFVLVLAMVEPAWLLGPDVLVYAAICAMFATPAVIVLGVPAALLLEWAFQDRLRFPVQLLVYGGVGGMLGMIYGGVLDGFPMGLPVLLFPVGAAAAIGGKLGAELVRRRRRAQPSSPLRGGLDGEPTGRFGTQE